MKNRLANLLQIKNSFLVVLVLIQCLIIILATLLTRMSLSNIENDEASKRASVAMFVTNAFDRGTSAVVPSVTGIVLNDQYMRLFASGDRNALFAATRPLFDRLNQQSNIKQMQFTGSDLKVLLRVHNPAIFGDDVTDSRPTLVECITEKKSVAGLEQGKSGYGFRAVAPSFYSGKFLGCSEVGLDLNADFLSMLNQNYPGQWAIVNLAASTSLTHSSSVLATLNVPSTSPVLSPDYVLSDDVRHTLMDGKTYFRYVRGTEQVDLEIPVRNSKGDIALAVQYVSPTAYYSTVRRMVLYAALISLVGMALVGIAFNLLYRGIRTPVHQLVLETEKIKNFDLSERVEIKASLVELEKLIRAVGDMKSGLQSFQKYVPANLVRQLIDTQQEARVGGKLQELTVFFSDIADFTTITENLAPNELVGQLSDYFNAVTEIILSEKGTVDKYIGDAVMAFWGAPIELPDHALLACRAALRCKRGIDAMSAKWRAEGKYAFSTRIGLSTGEMIVGNVGSEQRLNYSVIGDTVNLASRLEALNKQYKTSIILSETTYQSAGRYIEARLIDFVVVKGKLAPVRIYELIGEKGDISPRQKESLKLFATALDAYMSADFVQAAELFEAMKIREPEDAVTALYIERCAQFIETPPEPGWKGYIRYASK